MPTASTSTISGPTMSGSSWEILMWRHSDRQVAKNPKDVKHLSVEKLLKENLLSVENLKKEVGVDKLTI